LQAKKQVLEQLNQLANPRWFGELITEAGLETEVPPAELPCDRKLVLMGDARLAWMELPDKLLVFANGTSIKTTNSCRRSVEILCAHGCLSKMEVEILAALPDGKALLNKLNEAGCIDVE